MLFIIDMQNKFLDPESDSYVKDSEKLIPKIIEKIKEYEDKDDIIFYTLDIELSSVKQGDENTNDHTSIKKGEVKSDNKTKWKNKIHSELEKYLNKDQEIKKTYYAIPPRKLLEIQEKFKNDDHVLNEIEFVGVESNICVLANAICIQSAFPEAKIIIDSSLTTSRDLEKHKIALETMESLGMEIER